MHETISKYCFIKTFKKKYNNQKKIRLNFFFYNNYSFR